MTTSSPIAPLPSNRPAGCQFSLLSLFVIMTILALVFSGLFGIGRLFGMSAIDVLAQGLSQFLYVVPRLIVWTIGLTMALRRWNTNPRPARLATVAFSGMIVTTLTVSSVQTAVIFALQAGTIGSQHISWFFMALAISAAGFDILWWILILIALFGSRSEAAPSSQGDPFATPGTITAVAMDEPARQDPFDFEEN